MVGLLQEYVARAAERRPEATAVVLGHERVSYGELESRANRLARLLVECGCVPGDRIGLLLPKSPAAVAGMLAALKAGGIYVPIDPESPAARVEKILRVAECRFVLVSAPALALLDEVIAGFGLERRPEVVWMAPAPPQDARIDIRSSEADAAALSAEPLPERASPDGAAHILFTSGSTGTPKGVVIGHANVVAFIAWANDYFGLSDSDRVSNHSPLAFDLSTYDLYGAFAAGAEVHLVPPGLNLFPARLVDFIRDRRLTQWFSVPSILVYMARLGVVERADFPDLRRLLWCGEVFPTTALQYWMTRLPKVTFTNLYGPTETTIASSYYTVPAPPADADASVPIGTACAGEELLILSEDMSPQPPRQVGEIYISGVGVTLGYWRDEERTCQAFLPNPWSAEPGHERMYRTGDLGFRDADGLIYFVGRADSQIKSRGHRIELGEIEAALHTLPEVGQGVVVAVPAPEFGGHTICCAYVPRVAFDPAPHEVRERLSALLPKYMLPTRWRKMVAFPANANGKVDRVALQELFASAMTDHADRPFSHR